MTRVVLDGNVLLTGLISRTCPQSRVVDAWIAGQIQVFISRNMLEELKSALDHPHIQQRLAAKESARLVSLLERIAAVQKGDLVLNILTRDPVDNIYLACAREGDADYLVTGNMRRFTEVGDNFQGTAIITPQAFLEIINPE